MNESKTLKIPISIFDTNMSSNHYINRGIELFIRAYFYFEENIFHEVNTSLEQLIRNTGIKTETKKIRDKMRFKDIVSCLNWFIRKKQIYVNTEDELSKYNLKHLITFYNDIENPKITKSSSGQWESSEKFIKLSAEEYEHLVLNNDSSNAINDLFVYCFIKSKIWVRYGSADIKQNPECAILSYNYIATHCNLTSKTVENIVYNLKQMELIDSEWTGKNNESKRRSFPTVYVLKSNENWKEELNNGVNNYLEYTLTSKSEEVKQIV